MFLSVYLIEILKNTSDILCVGWKIMEPLRSLNVTYNIIMFCNVNNVWILFVMLDNTVSCLY